MHAAEAAFTSGDLDQAEVLCRDLLQDSAFLALASHLLGAIALMRKNPQQAAHWIERAIENGLANTIVLSNCGEAYRQMGRLEDAYTRFEQALKADNTNSFAHFNLGLVMRSLGHEKESEHFFRTALALKPEMARAHNELAELYRQEGHWEESEQEYKDALALVRGENDEVGSGLFVRWSIRLASLLSERGQMLRSVRLLEDVLQKDDYATAHYEIAKAEFELCWEESAIDHYARATQLQPSLGLHIPPRILSAKLASIKESCESGSGRYALLARSHFLVLPVLRVIPSSAKESFMLGTAVAPELGCASVLHAEILPREFTVLFQERLLVGGVINWFQHYAQRGQFVRHGADDGRVLLDLPGRIYEHDGACVLLGTANDQYSWLYESLARLWVIEQLPHLADLPLVVSSDMTDQHLAMLSFFGIPEERLLRLGNDCSIQARELHIPSLLTVGDWISPLALQFLRRRLNGGHMRAKRRIYLSREGLPDRRLTNEAGLLGLLEKNGFEAIKISEKSTLELLSIFREAEAVVGVDDEVMANLVVCPQGTRIGIIATAGAYRPRAHYICGQLAQDLTYLVGETQYESNPIRELCDVFLPENVLSTYLGEMGKPAR